MFGHRMGRRSNHPAPTEHDCSVGDFDKCHPTHVKSKGPITISLHVSFSDVIINYIEVNRIPAVLVASFPKIKRHAC